MILILIGSIMGLIAIGNGNIPVLCVGIVIVIIGFIISNTHDMTTRAWSNRTRYWAYGEKPDWAREREKKRKK